MVTKTIIPQELAPVSILDPQTTAGGGQAYILPTGTRTVYLVAHAKMGNAANLVLTPKSADDASGTNAAAIVSNIPIWVNGVRQADAKDYTITEAAGTFVVVFAMPSDQIPDSKFIGMSIGASDVANFLSVVAYKDTYHSN
jgi:hypothetical protein